VSLPVPDPRDISHCCLAGGGAAPASGELCHYLRNSVILAQFSFQFVIQEMEGGAASAVVLGSAKT
jgi:hypothetical protein